MALRLHNTLTRQKEEFRPLDPSNVRMYVCGPTVYDFAHIGNARPVIVFDVLYRLLRHLYGAENVTYVRNITDVDDKINARAARDFPDLPLNEAIRKVTETTNAQFQADVKALGCLEPNAQPRATEHIEEMKVLIERLVAKGVAYVADGHVLFSPSAMNTLQGPRYGALSRRSLDEMLAGARVDVASYKRDEMDFVLWKPSKEGEPGWPSPAGIEGQGRPGWHIECSAMAWKHLGEVFDIHAGGIDLVFPHHENEIAQSCSALGHDRMANVWMHNGFLQVEGRKMAKSEGNFVTIRELLAEWAGPVMRLVMLQTHYRQPIDWTITKLVAARQELADWATHIFEAELLADFETNLSVGNRGEIDKRVLVPLLDDLNSPDALTGLRAIYSEASNSEKAKYALLNAAHFLGLIPLRKIGSLLANSTFGSAPIQRFAEFRDLYLSVQAASANSTPQAISTANNQVAPYGLIFTVGESDGFVSLDKMPGEVEQSDNVKQTIEKRLAFIRDKNWAEADRIRDELLVQGIQLKDGKDPATGERVTTWEVKR